MSELDRLTAADFEALIGSPFAVTDAGLGVATLDLRTVDVSTRRFDERNGFSLLFEGPPAPIILQQIVPLSHPVLGDLGIFLVPVAGDAESIRYEAVFT